MSLLSTQYVYNLLCYSACSFVGFSQSLSASQQCFPLTTTSVHQTLTTPIQDSNHKRKEQVNVPAGGLDSDGRSGGGGETRWRRQETSHVVHRGEEGAAPQGALQGGRSRATRLPQLVAAEGQGAPGMGEPEGWQRCGGALAAVEMGCTAGSKEPCHGARCWEGGAAS